MESKIHNITINEDTTIWKNSKYYIPNTPNTNTSSFIRKNDFNYADIQLPILDGLNQSLGQVQLPNQTSITEPLFEPLTNISMTDNGKLPNNEVSDSTGVVSTKSTATPKRFVDYEFTTPDKILEKGLNALETRVDFPPILPEKTPEDVSDDLDDANEENNNDGSVGKVGKPKNIKKCTITGSWKTFTRNKTLQNAKKLAGCVVDNVPEMFAIPEMISIMIVKNATDKSKRKGIDYAQNVLKVKSHLKSFTAVLLCLYMAFNWWYLMLYTNHYIDMFQILKLPIFTPLIWIIGPLLMPISALNYYLLGKRTEPLFYKKYVEPVLKHKSFYLSMLFILIVVMYEPIIQLFTTNMKDILGESDKTNMLVGIVIAFAVLSFLYSVVFNTERNIQFISTVSVLVAIVAYLVMLILVIMLAKPVSIFVMLYFVFYSFLFLLFAENINLVGKIIEMMSDTTEQCLDNSSPSTTSKLMNVCYRYSFFILVFLVIFVRIGHALYDVQFITDQRVRVSCYAIYLSILIVFMILMGWNFWDVIIHVKQIIVGDKSTETTTDPNTEPVTSPATNDDDEYEFDNDDPIKKIITNIKDTMYSFGEQILLILGIIYYTLSNLALNTILFMKETFTSLTQRATGIFTLNLFGSSSTPEPPVPVERPTTPSTVAPSLYEQNTNV